MSILITGNMGYIGPVVIQRLRQDYPQETLIGLDTGYYAHCLTATSTIPEIRVDKQFFCDLRKIPEEVFHDVEAIVHLAAISNDPMGNRFEKPTMDINGFASKELAIKAKKQGVSSFVFASSCSMYGAVGEKPRVEEDELNPLTTYAHSKVYTEKQLNGLADDSFKVTCLRFGTACGMSPRLRLDLVLNDFVANAVAAKKIILLSDGTAWRPLIHVRDMARAIEWAIHRKPTEGGAFLAVNTGSEQWNYQIRDLANETAVIIGDVTVQIKTGASPDKRSYKVNFNKFKSLAPNHQPQMTLKKAIGELYEGLQEMNFNDINFRETWYMRLKVLTSHLDAGLIDENLYWKKR
jgi:nucleoside-diphosphate-sugar epimerase